jgi:hydrogenase nickel incorporation protein HypA/HybF
MHEQGLMRDLVERIVQVAQEEHAARVSRIRVQLGALSHFTPEHFREHFEDAARGTPAEGAVVDAVLVEDAADRRAADVLLESVEVEVPA